jgi:hypothetical protein
LPVHKQVILLLIKKNYQNALELMNTKNHEGLEKEYILAINGLLETGDKAFSQGDYVAAGRAFRRVLDSYPVEPLIREKVSRNMRQIKSSLATTADRLMDQGLQEYRRGWLESAISKWKVLLTFSPGHREAKKALDTAKVQLQALHNLND